MFMAAYSVGMVRSSYAEVFLGKGVLKICSKFTGEHTCRSVISINLQSDFIEITLHHGWSPVNLLHIFRTPYLKNTSERLLLNGAVYHPRGIVNARQVKAMIFGSGEVGNLSPAGLVANNKFLPFVSSNLKIKLSYLQ